jgi:mRNA-degrading endonuclease RelE of RelBE toxin-antitoxin system
MKYLFLNQFAFENIDNSLRDEKIAELFALLAYLLRDVRKFDGELIFDNRLSQFKFNNNSILHFLKLIEDKEARGILIIKIQKPTPFCSDSFSDYFEDENIVLGDCVVKDTNIDILENFLACAMFLGSPIITPKTVCQNSCFLNDIITITCNKDSKKLKNYFLENREKILKEIEESIKMNINSWQEWKDTVLPNYQNIDITNSCFKEINTYSFNSDISKSIINFIEEIDKFTQEKIVASINYKECCSNTKTESDTRLKTLKSKLSIYNCNDQKEIANWHTWIKKDFRLYFSLDSQNNEICFVKFTKKIT